MFLPMSYFHRLQRSSLRLLFVGTATSLLVGCGGADTDAGIVGGNTLLSVSRYDVTPELTALARFTCGGEEIDERTLGPTIDDEGQPVWELVFDLPPGDCDLLLRLFTGDGELVCQGGATFEIVANEDNFLEVVPVCPP